ncbi:DUF4347 domain-containing protein, partial [Sulfurimonas sp.]|uniref:DUF4347 domain-containing protein n=1 Tax=Sulfurimonas sp. TaxID=2022749 RepID=UPI0026045324
MQRTFLNTKSFVFVDAQLEDLETLSMHFPHEAKSLFLNSEENLLTQIATQLKGQTNVAALHLITHGRSGEILLGKNGVSLETLPLYGKELLAISSAMSTEGELFLYGCEIAAGERGAAFVAMLQDVTGLKIAAATHKVGHSELGGSWELDAAADMMMANALHVSQWRGVLVSTPFTLSLSAAQQWYRPDFEGNDFTSVTDQSGDLYSYAYVKLTPAITGNYSVTVTVADFGGDGDGDTVIFLYDSLFAVTDYAPSGNFIEGNDDSFGVLSKFTTDTELIAGEDYYLVITSYEAESAGTVTFNVEGDGSVTASGGDLVTAPAFTPIIVTTAETDTRVLTDEDDTTSQAAVMLVTDTGSLTGPSDFDGTTAGAIQAESLQLGIQSGATVSDPYYAVEINGHDHTVANLIINYGTLSLTAPEEDSNALKTTTGTTTLVNAGSIVGNVSLDAYASDVVAILRTGTIDGVINAGDASEDIDQLVLHSSSTTLTASDPTHPTNTINGTVVGTVATAAWSFDLGSVGVGSTYVNFEKLSTADSNVTLYGAGDIGVVLDIASGVPLKVGDTLVGGTVTAGVGSLITNGLTLGADGNTTFDLNQAGEAGTHYDQIGVKSGGSISVDGALTLNLGSSFTADVGDLFTLIDNINSSEISGNFMNYDGSTYALTEGAEIVKGAYTFEISYEGGVSDNDVVLIVTAAPDTTAPEFNLAETDTDGLYVRLNYDNDGDNLNNSTAPASAFAVTTGGSNNAVTNVSIDGEWVELTLTTPVTSGQTVTVAYTDPTAGNDANAIQDATGNDAVTIAAQDVWNYVQDTTKPTMTSAAVSSDGLSIVITYSEAVAGTLQAGDYAVTLSSGTATVTAAAIGTDADANKVTLTLGSAITSDLTVTNLVYTATAGTANSVVDTATPSNAALTQTLATVTNDSTAVPAVPSLVGFATSHTFTETQLQTAPQVLDSDVTFSYDDAKLTNDYADQNGNDDFFATVYARLYVTYTEISPTPDSTDYDAVNDVNYNPTYPVNYANYDLGNNPLSLKSDGDLGFVADAYGDGEVYYEGDLIG